MNKILANCISLGIGLGAIGVTCPAQAASFQGLGVGNLTVVGAGGTFANGVSADGSVVVGTAVPGDFSGNEAFRWTQATGMVGLGIRASEAYGVSADGSVVVGSSTGLFTEAFAWTQETGMVGLGFLEGVFTSQALGISADGSVAVGTSGNEAVRWTQTGIVGLGDLPGGSFYSIANGT